jgi:hypothetical protein
MKKCSLKIYEPTDTGGYAQFIANIRHMKNFFSCKQLPERGASDKKFRVTGEYLQENGLQWMDYISVCVDAVPSVRVS